jgi:hypothetical protein
MAFHVTPGRDLLAFIGRRLDVREMQRQPGTLDAEFQARYEVLDVVFGGYSAQHIEFTAFDHYGYPAFARHENALLYLSRHEGSYYHQKYLFQEVYRTDDGRWAGCGDPYRDMPLVHRHGVRPQPILFSPPVSFAISGLTESEVSARYPATYFRREGDRVRCAFGNYPDELFRVMAEGVLSARGVLQPARRLPHNRPLERPGMTASRPSDAASAGRSAPGR